MPPRIRPIDVGLHKFFFDSSNSEVLTQTLQWAQGSGPSVLMVGGGSGVGCTHLLVAAARAMHPDSKTWSYWYPAQGLPCKFEMLKVKLWVFDSANFLVRRIAFQEQWVQLADAAASSGVRVGLSANLSLFEGEPVWHWCQGMKVFEDGSSNNDGAMSFRWLPMPTPSESVMRRVFRAALLENRQKSVVVVPEAEQLLIDASLSVSNVRLLKNLAHNVAVRARLEGAHTITPEMAQAALESLWESSS